ncbi:GNAT family N-acetyltransferase [Nonomuraea antimicrobica]|uniref:GNAT family N-acetyltransferase n=1 Tax=Nonomuraea antimicrobica TaxID=561173 RepID=A0ABP7B7G0_9ACTN
MRIFLQTERLTLRPIAESDEDDLFRLHNDPEVMRHLNGGRPTPRSVLAGKTMPRFLSGGFYAALDRHSGGFLGWFHLRSADGGPDDEPELGYRLHQAAWGKGYATEGSRGLIDKAFAELGARRVFAQTMAVNLGSRRVMEKCGLRYVRTFHLDWPDPIEGSEQGEVEYELLRPEWEAAHGPDRH